MVQLDKSKISNFNILTMHKKLTQPTYCTYMYSHI